MLILGCKLNIALDSLLKLSKVTSLFSLLIINLFHPNFTSKATQIEVNMHTYRHILPLVEFNILSMFPITSDIISLVFTKPPSSYFWSFFSSLRCVPIPVDIALIPDTADSNIYNFCLFSSFIWFSTNPLLSSSPASSSFL